VLLSGSEATKAVEGHHLISHRVEPLFEALSPERFKDFWRE
jgi:hypothetical protein